MFLFLGDFINDSIFAVSDYFLQFLKLEEDIGDGKLMVNIILFHFFQQMKLQDHS